MCSKNFLWLVLTVFCNVQGAQRESRAETMARGGLVGVLEGVPGVPLVQLKYHVQAGKPLGSFPWARAYRGFGANAFASGPATLVQYGIDDGLKLLVGDTTTAARYATAATAGFAGAIVAAPSEALVMRAMYSDRSFMREAESIYRSHGFRGLQRGYVPTAGRDAVWALGYFAGKKDSVPAMIATGIAVAGVSHPFDVVKTHMQQNLDGASFVATLCELIKEGPRAVFAGFGPRALRIVVALGFMDKADQLARWASLRAKSK